VDLTASSNEFLDGNLKSFSQILEKPNQELGILNLSYEQLTMKLKNSKEKTENFNQELKKENEPPIDMAFKDGLTNLYNHHYFQDIMDRELSRAIRYKKPLSLLILDLDHSKKINDKHGCPVGDIVLEEVSKAIKNTIRDCDVAARYDGEKFAIVLPETDLKGAVIGAQRLKKAVEQLQIDTNSCRIDITASVGVTCYHPTIDKIEKSEFLSEADNALYHSKDKGGNVICIHKNGYKSYQLKNKMK
jgi:diguanylate cyclase (GGDEF)-like protein